MTATCMNPFSAGPSPHIELAAEQAWRRHSMYTVCDFGGPAVHREDVDVCQHMGHPLSVPGNKNGMLLTLGTVGWVSPPEFLRTESIKRSLNALKAPLSDG